MRPPSTWVAVVGWLKRIGASGLAGLAIWASWGLWLAAAPASAVTFPLDVALANGDIGEFALVDVTSDGSGGLEFEIRLLEDPGPRADLHVFYFNLPEEITGVGVVTLDDVRTPYTLKEANSPQGLKAKGGAGARFDYAVYLGNGKSKKGNGILQTARFGIVADQNLSIADLSQLSETKRGIEANIASHIQGLIGGPPTVAGVVPEPSTALLMGAGLLGLAYLSRRRAL